MDLLTIEMKGNKTYRLWFSVCYYLRLCYIVVRCLPLRCYSGSALMCSSVYWYCQAQNDDALILAPEIPSESSSLLERHCANLIHL